MKIKIFIYKFTQYSIMVKFYCEKCKYRFAPKNQAKLQAPKLCPYCGRAGTVRSEEPINSMIRNVDDMLEEY